MLENIENDNKIKWSPTFLTIKHQAKASIFQLQSLQLYFFERLKSSSKQCKNLFLPSHHRQGGGSPPQVKLFCSLYCCDLQEEEKSGLSFAHSQFQDRQFVSLYKLYLTFFPFGVVGMHRDVERTLIITISQTIVLKTQNLNKNHQRVASYVFISFVFIHFIVLLSLLRLFLRSLLVRFYALVMITIFVPLDFFTCPFLPP